MFCKNDAHYFIYSVNQFAFNGKMIVRSLDSQGSKCVPLLSRLSLFVFHSQHILGRSYYDIIFKNWFIFKKNLKIILKIIRYFELFCYWKVKISITKSLFCIRHFDLKLRRKMSLVKRPIDPFHGGHIDMKPRVNTDVINEITQVVFHLVWPKMCSVKSQIFWHHTMQIHNFLSEGK